MTAPLSPVRPGDAVRARAALSEPAGPPVPGGYDFSRRAYFDELGGSGYALGRLESAPEVVIPRSDRRAAWFAGVRAGLADRLRAAGGDGAGGVLAALVTGDRSEIAPDTTEALRAAGLGHILAISGMHLALVGGGAFFALSWLFAGIDPLARRCNPRKLAAAGALALSLVYLTISGAETPTQRAFIMAAVAFGAILADRRALTLRGVAIAALAVLLIAPESGVTPGFQMSFAASTALVAFNDHQRRRARTHPQPKEIGAIGAVRRFMFGLATTSLIAGTATAPFAAYHFNRFAGLGYFANFLAMPVFTVGVMPFAAIAGLLAPFGLEAAPAWVSARSIDLVTAIAEWTAAQPGAITPAPAAPPIALALAGAAFVAGAVLRQGRPLVVLALACLTVFAWRAEPRGALWIGENGGWLAQSETGEWVGDLRRGESYGAELFLRRVGAEGAAISPPGAARSFRCDASGCAGEVAGLRVAVAETWAGVLEDCDRADVVFTPGPTPDRVRARCGEVLLAPRRGRGDRGGVLEAGAGAPVLVTARGAARPWRPEARDG
jgi:competence protein ComEC